MQRKSLPKFLHTLLGIYTLAICLIMLANVLSLDRKVFPSTTTTVTDPELECALSSLFTDEMGYTLIGTKPVSIQEAPTYYLGDNPEIATKARMFLKKIFQNSPTFILKTSLEYDCCWIEFYNKTTIKKAIDEYPELRAFIQRKFSNEESFFSHIQHANESIFTTFDRNDFLLGLIFGYGRGNAEYYCRRLEVGTCLKKLPFFRLFRNNLRPHICGGVLEFFFLDDHYENPKKVLLEKDLDALEIEWSWIEDVSWDLRRLCRPVPPYYLSLPFYISRHGSDSEDIRNRYLKARDCLATLLYKRKFKDVITTLANLSQKNSL